MKYRIYLARRVIGRHRVIARHLASSEESRAAFAASRHWATVAIKTGTKYKRRREKHNYEASCRGASGRFASPVVIRVACRVVSCRVASCRVVSRRVGHRSRIPVRGLLYLFATCFTCSRLTLPVRDLLYLIATYFTCFATYFTSFATT